MQHSEFRRMVGADPRRSEPEILEHRASCPECAKYAADMERIDALVGRAQFGAVPTREDAPWAPRRQPVRWYAIAASLLVAVGLALLFWVNAGRDVLIAEVVKHADGERNVMVVSDKRVSEDKLQHALAKAGAQLIAGMPVSVARVCKIRGVVAPHLIMQTRDGAVAVLVLKGERTWLPHSFAAQGYQGRLIPKDGHAIAIVGTSEAAVKEGAELAGSAIGWPK